MQINYTSQRRIWQRVAALFLCLFSFNAALLANEVKIVDAKIEILSESHFRIHVTLEHADSGWDHYTNRWDVHDENGTLLGSRTLHHPHVNEQPFTRSLTVEIPATVGTVIISANDLVHGLGDATLKLSVPR